MDKKTEILLIDNDYASASDLQEFLVSKGFDVSLALSATKAKELIQLRTPTIVFIEIELSDSNGIDLCLELKKKKHLKNTYFIFLSSQSDNFLQISALNSGGDDYLIKPISHRLVLSKISSYLRRLHPSNAATLNNIEPNQLFIDTEKYLVYKGKNELELPKKQFEILSLMYQNQRKVFSRDDLKKELWDNPSTVNNRTIDVHIKKLREIIGDSYIKTVKGVGYKFDL